jgi:hypothetical protein
MVEHGIAQKAERLSRKRARMLPFLAVIYLSQQATFFTALDPAAHDTARYVKTAMWLVLTLLLLAGIATRGFWFADAQTRTLIDDEHTRSNRMEGMRLGFVVGMLSAVGTVILAMFEPVRANEAAQLVLSLGIGAALIRFGMLERRAYRDA